jgi:hypothetical protein
MGKPYQANLDKFLRKRKLHTLGSETSQYQEEKKQICISLVAASEKEEAQIPHHFCIFAKNFKIKKFEEIFYLKNSKAKM